MGVNGAELFIIIVILFVIFGLGRLGDIGESIGKMRRRALGPEAIDVSPTSKRGAQAQPVDNLHGPTEDAELVDDPHDKAS